MLLWPRWLPGLSLEMWGLNKGAGLRMGMQTYVCAQRTATATKMMAEAEGQEDGEENGNREKDFGKGNI